MMRKHASVLACLAAVFATPGVAWAQVVKSVGGSEGVAGMFLNTLTERVEQIFASLPALGDYLVAPAAAIRPRRDGAPARHRRRRPRRGMAGADCCCSGHGTASSRAMPANCRCAPSSHAALLDALALLALWIAARVVAGRVGDPHAVPGQIAHQILLGLLYWRGFNFVFRIWLQAPVAGGPHGAGRRHDRGAPARRPECRGRLADARAPGRRLHAGDRGCAGNDCGSHPAGRSGLGGWSALRRLALAARDGGMARRHGPAERRFPRAQARHGPGLVDRRPRLLSAVGAGGDAGRRDRADGRRRAGSRPSNRCCSCCSCWRR